MRKSTTNILTTLLFSAFAIFGCAFEDDEQLSDAANFRGGDSGSESGESDGGQESDGGDDGCLHDRIIELGECINYCYNTAGVEGCNRKQCLAKCRQTYYEDYIELCDEPCGSYDQCMADAYAEQVECMDTKWFCNSVTCKLDSCAQPGVACEPM